MSNPNKPYVVVVGVDYSETGDLAVERALRICQAEPLASFHAVHVASMILGTAGAGPALMGDPKKSSAELEARLSEYIQKKVEALRAKGARVPERVLTHVRWEAPGEEIAQLASDVDADVVVVGTHGRRGLSRMLMGSVAEAVVRLAPCPVFVVRPKGLPNIPTIEPPCAECVKVRTASNGATYWCEQHSEHHGQRHTYFNRDRIGSSGSLPSVGW